MRNRGFELQRGCEFETFSPGVESGDDVNDCDETNFVIFTLYQTLPSRPTTRPNTEVVLETIPAY